MRAVVGHRTSTDCHTFYVPPEPAARSAYLLIIPSTHQHPECTNTTNSRGESKQEEITLGQPTEDDHEAMQ
jgi:hypothetical protein